METADSSVPGPGSEVPGSCSNNGSERINSFALVAYIPDPMARFLDDLRRELVPGCLPRAHVTILPPRPIQAPVSQAIEYLADHLREDSPVPVRTGTVEIFEVTNVIYIGLASGREQLVRMHERVNRGPVGFDEPFAYHPHLTLAQQLTEESVPEVLALARRRWEEYRGSREFVADRITFVQNTAANRWLDLAEFRLGVTPSLTK